MRALVLAAIIGACTLSSAQAPVAHSTIPDEYIFRATNADLWRHVKALIRDLEMKTESLKDDRQLIVTRWTSYSETRFPERQRLGLADGLSPRALQVHAFVPAHLEPARLAIGVILEVRRDAGSTAWLYRQPQLGAWFVSQLSARLGSQPQGLADTTEGRAAQSRELMPPGVTDRCSTTPAAPAIVGGVNAPQRLSEFRPIYPGDAGGQRDAKVLVFGVITEHGTFVPGNRPAATAADPAFMSAARAAVGLWRYLPAMRGGCPILTGASVTVTFSTR